MIFVDNSYKWILGKPLFKKYTTVFNQDKKAIGFYTESKEHNETNNDNDKKDENKNNKLKIWLYLIIIFACIFLVCSIVLTVFLCKKYPFGKRKIKANELDDDYDYSTKNERRKKSRKSKRIKRK